MAYAAVNVGTVANDGTGDPLRSAYVKINANFVEVYARSLYTEKFEENDGTPTAHALAQTAQTNGAVVSLNGSIVAPADYTLTSTTLTLGLPVAQYDIVVITYLSGE